MSDKQFIATVTVRWEEATYGKDAAEARQKVKELVRKEYNITLEDREIKLHFIKGGEMYG